MKLWGRLFIAVAFASCARAGLQQESSTTIDRDHGVRTIRLASSYDGKSSFGGFSFGAFDEIASRRMSMAERYEKRGQYDRAVEVYDHLLKYSPTAAGVLIPRAYDELKLHRFDAALADLKTAVEEGSQTWLSDALSARCYARAAAGKDFDAALADCNKALDTDPHNADYLGHRGFLYYRMGQLATAKADLDAALASQDDDAEALYARGLVREGLGDAAGGEADIEAAEKIDPKIAETYAGYGVKP